jgi:hypothetical protein
MAECRKTYLMLWEFNMINENFNIEKMFGLDAYEEKYGVTPQEQTDEILFFQLDEVGAFINRNAPNISELNYLIFFKIFQELKDREKFNAR